MNDKILLAKCITLMYRESLLDIKGLNSADTVKTVLEFIKLPDTVLEINSDTAILQNLKKTAIAMCDSAGVSAYEPSELIQELKIGCMTDENLFTAMRDSIETIMEDKGLKISVTAISRQIQSYFRDKKAEEVMTKAYAAMKFKRSTIKDMRVFLANLCGELEPFTVVHTVDGASGPGIYDLSDKTAIVKAFEKVDDVSNGKALMKLGLQGINDMFCGGLRRGMTGIIYGLGHHYKSGLAMEWFRDFCMLNVPYMLDPTKKPCNLFISFENEAENNIDMWFKLIWESETGVSVANSPPMTAVERSAYLSSKLSQTGYHPILRRVQAGEWGYRDLCNYILTLESQGYEIHSVTLDYAHLMNKSGCVTGATGVDLQDLFKKIRSFMSVRDILCVSPHQLNGELKMLARDTDEGELVKKLPGAGYSYLCKTLENELDFELYLYLVKKKGKYYLTMQRGKHRVNNPAPIDKHYTCYESYDIGRLRTDIHGASRALKRPGERPTENGEINPHNAADEYFSNSSPRLSLVSKAEPDEFFN